MSNYPPKPEPQTYYNHDDVGRWLLSIGIKGDMQEALAAVVGDDISNGKLIYFDGQSLERIKPFSQSDLGDAEHLPYLRSIIEHFGPEVRIRYSW